MRKEKWEELKYSIESLKTIMIEEVNHSSSFLKIEPKKYILANGQKIIREKIIKGRKDGNASIVFPLTTDNHVTFVIQPRVFTDLTVGIGLPAGYVEQGEDILTSSKRELIEETGLESSDWINLGCFYQDCGCSAAKNYLWFANHCKKTSDLHLDEDEFILPFICTYEEALELYQKNYINEISSAMLFEKVHQLLKRRK